jgi:hypothetical protein
VENANLGTTNFGTKGHENMKLEPLKLGNIGGMKTQTWNFKIWK